MGSCPYCGYNNTSDAKFYFKYGALLPEVGEEGATNPESTSMETLSTDFNEEQILASRPEQPQNNGNQTGNQPVDVMVNSRQPAKQPASGSATASLVLGILALLVALFTAPAVIAYAVSTTGGVLSDSFVFIGLLILSGTTLPAIILGVVSIVLAVSAGKKVIRVVSGQVVLYFQSSRLLLLFLK